MLSKSANFRRFGLVPLITTAILLATSIECFGEQKTAQFPKEWPSSWINYYLRRESFAKEKTKFWPEIELRFQPDLFAFAWSNVSSSWKENLMFEIHSSGKLDLQQTRKHKDRHVVRSLIPEPGIYFVSLSHWIETAGYQTVSNIVVIKVSLSDKENGPRLVAEEIEISELETDYVNDATWSRWENFHRFLTGRPLPEEAPPFEPAVNIEEVDGPSMTATTDLPPSLLPFLEWRQYFEGQLVTRRKYQEQPSLLFSQGPGAYVTVMFAKHGEISIPVSAPVKSLFFEEGDGILRRRPLDTDKDGIPDYWEKMQGLDPADPFDPTDFNRKHYKNEVRYGRAR